MYVLNTFQWDGVIQISWNFSLVYVPSHTPTGKRIIDEIYFKLFLLAMLPKLWLFKTSNKHALFYAGPLLADNAE